MEGELLTSSNRKSSAATGIERKTRDNAADWFNLMVRWERLNEEGFTAATNIINLRRSLSDQLLVGRSSWSPSAGPEDTDRAAALQEECYTLQEVINKMAAMVMKMDRLMTSQRAVQELDEFHFGPEGRTFPLCHSWTTRQFEECACFLLDAFHQELELKRTVLQEVAHAPPELGMLYLSCWLHQPYVPPQARLTLEALLLETGHHPL
ncbi:cyclin-dependent kinase 2-interacting protein [Cololabis saira]|uniref:cyclin-dependent kinase 2-interacting protein n=1 Tax=Cololabis saira TaxID=129043 RepID=UPI002AD51300|nr:cyclin-dependent kinase 2-interacting protein [Cololabis saira]